MVMFAPWQQVDHLPDETPVRRLRAEDLPRPPEVTARLSGVGIDPDSASAIMTAIFRRGWTVRLVGSARSARQFTAAIIELRFGAVWAMANGPTPAAALGAVYVLSCDAPSWDPPPPERGMPEMPAR